jgi:uncharacterized membrane protein (UPF0127 family)
MQILNATRNVSLATAVKVSDSFLTRGRGLIGSAPLQAGEAMIIRPCKGVHTWFMSYPIDVIYVDSANTVLGWEDAMVPWKLGRPRVKARYVIEMPAHSVKESGTQVGDQLALVTE